MRSLIYLSVHPRVRVAFLLFALGAAAATRASPPDMLFTRLGADQGLSHGAVRAIVQDADGFMWVGTEDGMDRYDGYELRHFFHQRGVPGSLPAGWISAMASDHTGRLWIGSVGSGVVAGIVLTLALSKVMSHWATDSASSFNPLVIIGATLILAAVAALACALPARRAAEVDPMKAIRYE